MLVLFVLGGREIIHGGVTRIVRSLPLGARWKGGGS